MIKIKHLFHENTSSNGNGQDYLVGNKNSGTIMAVSCGDLNNPSTATAATIEFYGKATGSNKYVRIKAIKASDYSIVETGSINESYILDLTSFQGIRVTLKNVSGGKVTVIGEVIE